MQLRNKNKNFKRSMANNSGKYIIAISEREKEKLEIYRNTMIIKFSGFWEDVKVSKVVFTEQ